LRPSPHGRSDDENYDLSWKQTDEKKRKHLLTRQGVEIFMVTALRASGGTQEIDVDLRFSCSSVLGLPPAPPSPEQKEIKKMYFPRRQILENMASQTVKLTKS
jgi:hypothetical protein